MSAMAAKAPADRLARQSKLFGSPTRTAILVGLRLLEESYPSELAALLSTNLYTVQRVLESLESDGVIVSRTFGKTRRVTFNPRYFAHAQLSALLWQLGTHDHALQRALASRRRRPRRSGKPGL